MSAYPISPPPYHFFCSLAGKKSSPSRGLSDGLLEGKACHSRPTTLTPETHHVPVFQLDYMHHPSLSRQSDQEESWSLEPLHTSTYACRHSLHHPPPLCQEYLCQMWA